MTKEEFIESIRAIHHYGLGLKYLDRSIHNFFKDKVIIQRGENRHPYADVLHEWLEDTTKVLQSGFGKEWYETTIEFKCKWRIKPSEPIYEWQCLYAPKESFEYRLTEFMTEAEIMQWKLKQGKNWKIEQIDKSKRERK